MKRILAEGPRAAKIFLCGESPWISEEATGRPFAGASGNLLKRIWDEVGLRREQILIDNVYPFKPPDPAPVGDRLASVDTETLIYWMRDLHQRIGELDDPYVLVPTGNYAVFALLGKGKVPARVYKELGREMSVTEAEKKVGITKLRGSIYLYTDVHGRQIKVIPTIHPAAILQHMGWEERTVRDWERIKEEAETKEYKPVHRFINSDPTLSEVQDFYLEIGRTGHVSIDIETWGKTLTCVGFACSPTKAIVLKTYRKEDLKFWYPWIKLLCAAPAEKILQNGLYDAYWLAQYNIQLVNWCWDTMHMHHALDPVEEHALEYLASIYTKQPYWKDEAKGVGEVEKYTKDLDDLWHYNGLDCCVTFEVWEVLKELLEKEGMLRFYTTHYPDLAHACLDTMLHGIRVDTEKQKGFAKQLLGECDELREKLKEAAGEELYATGRKVFHRRPTVEEWKELLGDDHYEALHETHLSDSIPPKPKYINREAAKRLGYIMKRGEIKYYKEHLKKDFSEKKLSKFFYETLGLPKQVKRKTGKETLDETALRKIAQRYQKQAGQYAMMVVKHREKKKEADYVKGAWDKDGRIRCTYKLTTKTGRLASATNPLGRGYNLQNPKRGEIRSTFLADEGCILVGVDLSQVEHRLLKMYTRQSRMIELARLRPSEYDTYIENAKVIYRTEEVSKEQRYFTKHVILAAERGMHGKHFSEDLLNEGIFMPPKQCQKMLDSYFEANPEIEEHYFKWVREQVIRDRKLVNSWGRVIYFKRDRFENDLYMKCYAWYVQSEAAELLNQWGFVALWKWLKMQGMRSKINLQVHDEVVVSCPPEEAYAVADFLVRSLEKAREYFGSELRVPCEISIGLDWHNCYEWKQLPSEEEFNRKVWEILDGKGVVNE